MKPLGTLGAGQKSCIAMLSGVGLPMGGLQCCWGPWVLWCAMVMCMRAAQRNLISLDRSIACYHGCSLPGGISLLAD